MMNYFEEAQRHAAWITAQRHFFHRHPELGFELPKTQAHLCEALREIGLTPRQLKCGGVLAELSGKEKPCILLRADMDALPLTECSGVPFASEHPGMMHACGHDTHMAMLLGAAAMLKQHEAELQGKVLICFQPAEEIMRGAEALLQELPTEPDFAFALHIFPTNTHESGTFVCPEGGYMSSSDVFAVTVTGKSAHGSTPNQGRNPLYPAMEIAQPFIAMMNNEKDPRTAGALSVCAFHCGETHNIIPNSCWFKGTLRMMDEQERRELHTRMRETVAFIGKAHRVDAELVFEASVPSLFNDPILARKAQGYLERAAGRGVGPLEEKRNMVSEDFALFGQRMPAVMFELLSRSPENAHYPGHNPRVTFDDSILHRGAAAYAQVAQDYLSEYSPAAKENISYAL